MLFVSTPFYVFFAILFVLYWFVFNRSLKLQNLLILTASYVFYAWWDWRFLSLLIGSSLLNYYLGIYMAKTHNEKTKSTLMWIGTITGIGFLIYFKYTNFFIVSFVSAFAKFNIHLNIHTLKLILPLGISFYTFRTLSYLFDINKGKIEPTTDWVVFFSYVAFFPCLLSGPIDRAKTLIPQLEKKREFIYSDASDALRQILWGLFKKIVIADNCAVMSNNIFDHYSIMPASSLVLGAFYYTIQIYADFSGYSDMAIGIARLLGIQVTKNFDFPFFAQNIADYWRKWHISLTSWLTDYVFTPLSITFRDYGKTGLIMAILINFTLIGMWHGANWTFVLFGFMHGCYYIPLIIKGTFNKRKKIDPDKLLPSFKEFYGMATTFMLVMFTLVLFRSDTITQAFKIYRSLFSASLFSIPEINKWLFIFIPAMLIVEWLQRNKQHGLQIAHIKSPVIRMSIYYILVLLVFKMGPHQTSQFMYFQF